MERYSHNTCYSDMADLPELYNHHIIIPSMCPQRCSSKTLAMYTSSEPDTFIINFPPNLCHYNNIM